MKSVQSPRVESIIHILIFVHIKICTLIHTHIFTKPQHYNTSFLNTFRYLDILNSVVIILRIQNDVWSPTDNRVQDRATLLTISAAVTPHHAPRRRRAAARALLARRARVGAAGLREAEAAPGLAPHQGQGRGLPRAAASADPGPL